MPHYPTPPAGRGAQYPPPPASRAKKSYVVDRTDTIWALVALGLGFVVWNWLLPTSDSVVLTKTPTGGSVAMYHYFSAFGVTALVVVATGCSLAYFRRRSRRITRPAMVGLVLLLLAAIPHTLYALTPVHLVSGPALLVGYILWHAYAANTAIAPGLSALTTVDLVNQGFVVPMTNAGSWRAALHHLRRGRRPVRLLAGIAGLAIALPVFIVVLSLLASADSQFHSWVTGFGEWLTHLPVWTYLWQFVLGIPVAGYVFASWFGNARRSGTERLTADQAHRGAHAVHRINPVALAAPVAGLCLVYLIFFAAMSTYVFSAFAGRLPADFTYAVYARQGFFQLVVVAAINLFVVGFMHFFARRREGRYPAVLRALGGILAALTLVMVTVAMSKMLLYLGRYDLTRLRAYTLWFMAVLLIVFALLLVWHIRPFRVSVPIVWLALLSFLALSWANTDGIIADYNVDQYLNGARGTVDVDYLANSLSDAAIPALIKLRDQAPDLADQVTTALRERAPIAIVRAGNVPWTAWNWQTWHADQLLTH
jgi:hypothetical protein